MSVRSYQDLDIWKKSMLLTKHIYQITENFPSTERYRLTDQLCRAAISVPSNIAEGSSRKSTKEFIRYIHIAYGSLAEMETQLLLACELGYLKQPLIQQHCKEISELGKMMNGLLKTLTTKLTELRTLNSELIA